MKMEQINQKYRDICISLGDIVVKIKGLENQKNYLFEELEKLDALAEQAMKAQTEEKSADED